ncbi:HNRNPUL1 [Acanthosepion pharaonis]|uniref:HNRNPUL1 n=1 Tax=Acanthosepion pharaonis TaxID=158019 RepID=A0A812D821_ACAPH|nr:HNRNPUL1 [Sepia pharaonis]
MTNFQIRTAPRINEVIDFLNYESISRICAHDGASAIHDGCQPILAGAPAATLIPTSTPPAVATLPGHPAHAAAAGHVRKRTYEEARRESIPTRGPTKWPQQESSASAEVGTDEPRIDDAVTVLDFYNSDLNLVIDPDCYGGKNLTEPEGFCFTWAGARATYGVTRGKVFYEVHIIEHLPVNFGDDHTETHPHVVRIGWSIDKSSFQLGEEPNSYGFGGTGKFSVNSKFTNYGEPFGAGDVIGCLLDLESRPPTISYSKNGRWYGVACPLHTHPVGKEDLALFPHVLSKNCKFKVNFGQTTPWFPPPPGFAYIDHVLLNDRVRASKCPPMKSDCEMIMIVGLPGCGKTSWALNMYKTQADKKYYIIGTDSLIDKMRVMGLPRKRFFHGRWDVLIQKATGCLNKLFQIASRRRRNIILDQTNVYATARKRKMRNFQGFYRKSAVLVCEDSELIRRSNKRTKEDGKVVPEEAVLEMKANFSLPDESSKLFDSIEYIELPKEKALKLVEQYNEEGKNKRPARDKVFKHDNRPEQTSPKPFSPRMSQGPPPSHQVIKTEKPQMDVNMGQRAPLPPPPPPPGGKDRFEGRQSRWGPATDVTEPPEKRVKPDPSSALDFIKQEYSGEGEENSPQWQDIHVKQESRSYDGYGGQYSSNASTGSASGSYGTQLASGTYGYQTNSGGWGSREQSTPASYSVQNPTYGTQSYQSSYSSADTEATLRSGASSSTASSSNWYGTTPPANTSAPPPPPPPPPMKQEPVGYNDQYSSYNQLHQSLPPQMTTATPAPDTKAWGIQSQYGTQPSQYSSPPYTDQQAYQSSGQSFDYGRQQYNSSATDSYGQTEQSSYSSAGLQERSGSTQPAAYSAQSQYSGYQQTSSIPNQYGSNQSSQYGHQSSYGTDQQSSYSDNQASNQISQYGSSQQSFYSGSSSSNQSSQYSSNQPGSYNRNQSQYGAGTGGGATNQYSSGNQDSYGSSRYPDPQSNYSSSQSSQYGGVSNQSNQRGSSGGSGQQLYGGYQSQYGGYDQSGGHGGPDSSNRNDQQSYQSHRGDSGLSSSGSSMMQSSSYGQGRGGQWQSSNRQRSDGSGGYGSSSGYSDYQASKPKDEAKKSSGRGENQRRTRWSDADPAPSVQPAQPPESLGGRDMSSSMQGNYPDSGQDNSHQRSDHMGRMDHMGGGRMDHMGGRPDHMGGRPEHMGGRPDHMGGRSDHMGGRPDHMSNRPDHMGGRPDHMGGRPDHMSGRPDHMGGRPDHMGGRPDHMGSRQDHMGGRPDHMGGRQDHMGSRSDGRPDRGGYGRPDRGGYGRPDRGGYGRPDRDGYGRSDRREGRSDRDGRSDRSDRDGRPDRGDRSDRDRSDRSGDRSERDRPDRGGSDRDRDSSRGDRGSDRSDRDSSKPDRSGDRTERTSGDKSDRSTTADKPSRSSSGDKADRSSSSSSSSNNNNNNNNTNSGDKADRSASSSSGEKAERNTTSSSTGEKTERSTEKTDRSSNTSSEKPERSSGNDKPEKTERVEKPDRSINEDTDRSGDKPDRDVRRSDRGRPDRDMDSGDNRPEQMGGRFNAPGGRMDHPGMGRPDFFPDGDRCMDMGPPGQFGGFGGPGDMNRDHGPPGRFMGPRGGMNQPRGPRPNFDGGHPGGPRPRFDGPRRGGPRGMAPRDHGADFGGPGGPGGPGGWNQGNMRGMGPRRPPRFEGRGGGPPRGMRPGGPPRWPRPH